MDSIVIENRKIETPVVLCIDDDRLQLNVYDEYLRGQGYRVELMSEPYEALRVLAKYDPDLILLDINMPEMDGFEFMMTLRKISGKESIPVIMISGLTDQENIVRSLRLGAVDYIRKPLIREELVLRVKIQIENVLMKKINSVRFENLESYVRDQLEEIKNIKNATIFSLAKIAESRDPETGEHLDRIREYAKVLAEELSNSGVYSAEINNEFVYNIYNMSVLHDIGKVGIPDHVLLKPGKLTPDEFEVMKTHTVIGGRALEATSRLNKNSTFLEMGKLIAFYHHEKWDGSGYPKGLKSEEIPLAARITSMADIYDALSFRRVYRDYAFEEEVIDDMIRQEAGKTFDPEVYEAYRKLKKRFIEIKTAFSCQKNAQ